MACLPVEDYRTSTQHTHLLTSGVKQSLRFTQGVAADAVFLYGFGSVTRRAPRRKGTGMTLARGRAKTDKKVLRVFSRYVIIL